MKAKLLTVLEASALTAEQAQRLEDVLQSFCALSADKLGGDAEGVDWSEMRRDCESIMASIMATNAERAADSLRNIVVKVLGEIAGRALPW